MGYASTDDGCRLYFETTGTVNRSYLSMNLRAIIEVGSLNFVILGAVTSALRLMPGDTPLLMFPSTN